MGKISENKIKIRHKEWAAMVSQCQASGKKVEEWCAESGIKISTYYKRLSVLKSELIEKSEKQTIVPVSVSAAIADANNTVIVKTSKSCGNTIMIRKNGIEIELPQDVSESMLMSVLRGMQEC